MKKLLIGLGAAAVVAVGAVVLYPALGPDSGTPTEPASSTAAPSPRSGSKSDPVLSYIPADTAILSLQMTPLNWAQYLKAYGFGEKGATESITQLLDMAREEADTPVKRFFLHLATELTQSLQTPDEFVKKIGLKAESRSVAYMVGLYPVAKMEVSDPDAFFALFDAAEAQSGFQHIPAKLGEVSYREYPIVQDQLSLSLLVSVKDNWATLIIKPINLDPNHLAIALSTEKPEESLADSSQFNAIVSQYQLNRDLMGYIRSDEIIKGITQPKSNRLSLDIERLALALDEIEDLNKIRIPSCQQDLSSIAKNWPGLFIDAHYNLSSANQLDVSSRMLLPVALKPVLDSLKTIRGFVPAHILAGEEGAMLQVGVGLDVVQLAASLDFLNKQLSALNYQCPLLADFKTPGSSITSQLFAISGMANGLKGASITVNEVKMGQGLGQFEKLDALISVSATQIVPLLEAAKMFIPPAAAITLPTDGKEHLVTELVPEAAMLGMDVKMRLSDHHLLVYTGSQAQRQAETLIKQQPDANGTVAMYADYKKFFALMKETMASTGMDFPGEMNLYGNMKAFFSMDITDQGILFSSRVKNGE